jgi:hypothetical protein
MVAVREVEEEAKRQKAFKMGTEKEQEKEGEDWRRIGRASAL